MPGAIRRFVEVNCMRPLNFVAVVLICIWLGLPAAADSLLRERAQFTKQIHKITAGMTEDQVVALIGKPDDIVTSQDTNAFYTGDTEWCYGTDGHMSLPTLGRVYFFDHKVAGGYGLVGTTGGDDAPPPDMFTEQELRNLLRLIGQTNTGNTLRTGNDYNPQTIIAVVNALQPLGKTKAAAALREYCRITHSYDYTEENQSIFLILRVLFDVPSYLGYMPVTMVADANPAYPGQHSIPGFPIIVVDDVPLDLSCIYLVSGVNVKTGVIDDIDFFQKNSTLRSRPLTPKGSLEDVLTSILAAAPWQYIQPGDRDPIWYIYNPRVDGAERRTLRGEVLRMVGLHVATDNISDMRWNAALNRFTLPDDPSKN
jgi:hypothetical protein